MMIRRLAPFLGLLACIGVALTAEPLRALDNGTVAVSRSDPEIKKEYQPVPGNNPAVVTHRPTECKTAAYCDTLQVNVDTKAFKSDEAYQLNVTLTFPNGAANDMDLYVYDNKEIRVAASNASNDPERTSVDRPYTGVYYVVVNNSTGPNTGYTISLELEFTGKLKAIPKFERPEHRPMFTPLPPLPQAKTTPAPETGLAPSATLAPVITPGPDGPAKPLALSDVPAGARVEKAGTSWWMVLIWVVVAVAVLGGTGFLLFRRVQTRRA